ncbi:MAG: 7-cyano-7-deazaguanine synthase [Pseudomonadota bacterium]
MQNEYHYLFDPDGQIRCHTSEVWRPIARTSLDGLRSTTWLGPFGQQQRDLLRVMAAVLEADRLSPRRPRGGKRLERDLAWQRRLSLRIAVESPDRWKQAIPQLSGLVSFMTDDAWLFDFDGFVKHHGEQQLLPFETTNETREVALFSGGLDSVAGALARSRLHGGRLLAISACGNDVRGSAQKSALETLRSVGVSASWLKLDHQLRGAGRPRSGMESSQRSRGLLFLAMGATAASQLEIATFAAYETGVGCINLPTSAAQVGAHGTRAMHPRTLSLFNDLVAVVLDKSVRVVAPFFLHTKGELCRLAASDLPALAAVTMSCDEGEGHKQNAMLHCGLCTSCLFRRIALGAGTSAPDPTTYRDVSTKRHGVYEVNAFENHASQLLKCQTFDDLLDLDPDARFATRYSFSDQSMATASEAAIFAMFQRYATEIHAYLSSSRPTVAKRIQQPRKERERDLFSATR